jgi:DNA-binding NtrC family response regulator
LKLVQNIMSQPAPAAATNSPVADRRAVLVDDDPALLRLMTTWLSKIGFTVEAFTQFEPAKRQILKAAPDLLVTDVRLGAYNGLQLVVLAKLTHPDSIAIVLTGFDDPVIRRTATDAGSIFLAKPVRAEQLIDVVETYSSVIS